MSNVVSFTKYRQSEGLEFDYDVDEDIEYFNDVNSFILDLMPGIFKEGICVGVVEGGLHITSTMQDKTKVKQALEEALETLGE